MAKEALQIGFFETHRHKRAIALDVVWKLIWLLATLMIFAAFCLWVYGELGVIEWNGPVAQLRNPLTMLLAARGLWNAYATKVFTIVFSLALVSVVLWILLESYFRAGMFAPAPGGFFKRASKSFGRFFGLACAKLMFLTLASAILAGMVFRTFLVSPLSEWRSLWMENRPTFLVSIIILSTIWFVLTTAEILIRRNALSLLGPHLFKIAGTFAGLWLFEFMIAAAVAIGVVILASILPVSAATVLAGAGLLSFALLTFLHSYLVAVRFQFVVALQKDAN